MRLGCRCALSRLRPVEKTEPGIFIEGTVDARRCDGPGRHSQWSGGAAAQSHPPPQAGFVFRKVMDQGR